MIATLLLAAALYASTPFPIDPAGDPALLRLRDAWTSAALHPAYRAEMDARLRAAAAGGRPDWEKVATDYFAWRNADAAASDARNAEINVMIERTQAEIAARPVVCNTETLSEPGLYGNVYSRSTTRCSK